MHDLHPVAGGNLPCRSGNSVAYMKYDVQIKGQSSAINIIKEDAMITVERNGKKSSFAYHKTTSGYILEKSGKIFHTNIQSQQGEKISVNVGDKTLNFEWKDPYAIRSGNANGGDHGIVKAVMPGRVVKILVKLGEDIEINQPLLVLEAMKMENEIKSAKAGKISGIQIQEGDSVDSGAALMTIE